MRVLMTTDAVGGVWQYAVQLSALLASRGARVLLATMGPAPSPAQAAEARSIRGVTLRTSTFALEWMPDPWIDVDQAGAWLLALEMEFAPDVVHINGYAHGVLPFRAPTLVVGHSCVCSWWEAVHGTEPPTEWSEYISRVSAGLRAATAVVAPTHMMANALQRLYRVGRDIRVIRNGRDASARHGRAKEPLIFAAGRAWDPAKNLAALDHVATHIPWPVYAAGDTTGPAGGRAELLNARGLERLGPDDMAQWMSRAAIYALPARYEPFGLSVLEAALAGCALVLGDIPSLRENWNGAARFVHPDRPDELRCALQDLIDRRAARDDLAAAARARAQNFSTAQHVEAYNALYREMVTTHGRIAHSAWSL